MDKIAERLKVYIDTHPFDSGDGDYETTALQLLIYAHEELYGGDWG